MSEFKINATDIRLEPLVLEVDPPEIYGVRVLLASTPRSHGWAALNFTNRKLRQEPELCERELRFVIWRKHPSMVRPHEHEEMRPLLIALGLTARRVPEWEALASAQLDGKAPEPTVEEMREAARILEEASRG